MEHARSADGTRIAFERIGEGRPVVILGGAFSTRAAALPLASALADVGFQGVAVDRRARGASSDRAPYAPQREVEDLAAVVEAVGGDAAVLGHSSGAVLALLAVSRGVPVVRLFLSEPPLRFGVDEPAADLPDRLQDLLDEGRREDAVVLFQREGVGLPEAVVEQIRASPIFPGLLPLAQSAVYDAALVGAVSDPPAEMLAVRTPVTVLRGEPTFPFLVVAAERLAEALPVAELVIVPESRDHAVDPAGTAGEVAARLDRA